MSDVKNWRAKAGLAVAGLFAGASSLGAMEIGLTGEVCSLAVTREYVVENLTTGGLTIAEESAMNVSLQNGVAVQSDNLTGWRYRASMGFPISMQLVIGKSFNRANEKVAPTFIHGPNERNWNDEITYSVWTLPLEAGVNYSFKWQGYVFGAGVSVGWLLTSVEIEMKDAVSVGGTSVYVNVVERRNEFYPLAIRSLRVSVDREKEIVGTRWGLWGSIGITERKYTGDVPNEYLNLVGVSPNRNGGRGIVGGLIWKAGWQVIF